MKNTIAKLMALAGAALLLAGYGPSEAGADVNAKTMSGVTALMGAVDGGHADTVKLLIDAGADVNAKTDKGFTALMGAANLGHAEVVKLLVEAGARE